MIQVNIHEAKAKFSHYLHLAEQGETVIICKRNIPLVELKPAKKNGKRKLGFMQKQFPDWKGDISNADKPLDKEIVDAFENSPIFPK